MQNVVTKIVFYFRKFNNNKNNYSGQKMKLLISTISAALMLLTSCTGMKREPIRPMVLENGSAVDLRTAKDAAELLWNSMQRGGCRQTDTITPITLEKSPDFQAGKGRVIKGRVVERWIASGCNKKVPYIVSFFANHDNEGGSDIELGLEKSFGNQFSNLP